jgi:predicted DNA binding protein
MTDSPSFQKASEARDAEALEFIVGAVESQVVDSMQHLSERELEIVRKAIRATVAVLARGGYQ